MKLMTLMAAFLPSSRLMNNEAARAGTPAVAYVGLSSGN